MSLPYIHHRKRLVSLKNAIQKKCVTFGFIGGSITDARPKHNWPQFFIESFINNYPDVRCRVENAAIGATGSDLAVFRAHRDLINRGCDIVFIEYAVNDEDVEPTRRFRSREGLIRQLLHAGISDLVLVYTYSDKMRPFALNEQYPETIAHFERLAEHYQLPSIWIGKYGLDQVLAGKITMEAWLPDGLHPLQEGSKIYAEIMNRFIDDELNRVSDCAVQLSALHLPQPLDPLCWEKTSSIPFSQLVLHGKWQEYRWHSYEWIDTVLETTDKDASFSFTFTGRGVVFIFDYGNESYEFKYRINNGEWTFSNRDCPDWVGPDGWFRLYEVDTNLPYSQYKVEVSIVEEATILNEKHFRLGKVGVIL